MPCMQVSTGSPGSTAVLRRDVKKNKLRGGI
jgi:hypothetical protein